MSGETITWEWDGKRWSLAVPGYRAYVGRARTGRRGGWVFEVYRLVEVNGLMAQAFQRIQDVGQLYHNADGAQDAAFEVVKAHRKKTGG